MKKIHTRYLILHTKYSSGFTLIEILISIALIAVLISILVFRLNPASILAKARNDQRELNVNVILNAIGQNIANNSGTFNCEAGPIPTSTPVLIGSSTYNIYDCLIPEFMSAMPVDPQTGTTGNSSSTYDTKYDITRNPTTTQITISAPDAELEEAITVTR